MHRVVNTHHKKKKTESHGGIFVREKDGSMRIKEDVEKDKRSRACTPRSSRKILNQSSWPVSRAVNGYTLYLHGAQIATHLITVQYAAGRAINHPLDNL